jgi:hypothetical protein
MPGPERSSRHRAARTVRMVQTVRTAWGAESAADNAATAPDGNLAHHARTPCPARLTATPTLGRPATRGTAVTTLGLDRPIELLAALEQATTAKESPRGCHRLLRGAADRGILMKAQGSCRSRRSRLGASHLLAPRHSLNSIQQSRLPAGQTTRQDVNERSATHAETAINRSRPDKAMAAKVVKSLTATDTPSRFGPLLGHARRVELGRKQGRVRAHSLRTVGRHLLKIYLAVPQPRWP